MGEEITHGPLIHAAAVAKVQRHVEDAKSKGARVLVGGEKMEIAGHFFQVRPVHSSVEHSLMTYVVADSVD